MTGETLSFPIIADVDADGSTDLLLPTSAPDLTTVGGFRVILTVPLLGRAVYQLGLEVPIDLSQRPWRFPFSWSAD